MAYNIMVVEDNLTLRSELTFALTEAVFEVVGCADYLEALLRLNEFKPDLVILNEELPLVDGWEACYQLHWIFGMPIILIGESSGDDAWVKVLQAGADFYLRIPFSYVVLTARIKAILRRYKTGIIHQN